MMQFYSFFNSSTSWRVRIALALKGLTYDYLPVDIRAGAHCAPDYIGAINPSASVPAIVEGDLHLGQSLAIVDWLDQRHPDPRLIPMELDRRMRVLEFSYLIACDIHPVNNLRVLRYLQDVLGVAPNAKDAWYAHWIAQGMAAAERLLTRYGDGPWTFGAAEPTLADCCLIPQIANAERMNCDLSAYPRCVAVYQHAMKHPAFETTRPANQPDYKA